MVIIENRPYVWLDKSSGNKNLLIKMWSFDKKIVNHSTPETDGDTLRLVFTCLPGSGESSVKVDLLRYFQANVHTKVTVIVIDDSNTILGLHTVMPEIGVFAAIPSLTSSIIPYMWLDFVTTEQSILNMAVVLPGGSAFTLTDTIDYRTQFIREVYFTVNPGRSADTIIPLTYNLDSSTGYDPVLDMVIVHITELDNMGVEKKKGTGTVHTSEGDASSEI